MPVKIFPVLVLVPPVKYHSEMVVLLIAVIFKLLGKAVNIAVAVGNDAL